MWAVCLEGAGWGGAAHAASRLKYAEGRERPARRKPAQGGARRREQLSVCHGPACAVPETSTGPQQGPSEIGLVQFCARRVSVVEERPFVLQHVRLRLQASRRCCMVAWMTGLVICLRQRASRCAALALNTIATGAHESFATLSARLCWDHSQW